MTSIIKVKWRTRFKIVLVDIEDFDKVKDIKWTYYNYGNFVGYNLKTATKKRIKRIEECILGECNGQIHEIIHVNKNGLDNRKENLKIVSHFVAQQHKNQFTREGKVLLESYNEFVNSCEDLTPETKEGNICKIPDINETPLTIKKPKIKKINIEGIIVPDELKEFLYYNDKSDYFYIIGHPIIFEKLNRRRLQGSKSKTLSTKEKFEEIQNQLKKLKDSI